MEVAEEILDDACVGIALDDELADARQADGDEGEFDGSEEAVQGDKRDDADDTQQQHAERESPEEDCNSRGA